MLAPAPLGTIGGAADPSRRKYGAGSPYISRLVHSRSLALDLGRRPGPGGGKRRPRRAQDPQASTAPPQTHARAHAIVSSFGRLRYAAVPVSYTHLTLP